MKDSDISAVSGIFLFKGCEKSVIASYLSDCESLSFSSGEIIHSLEHPANGIGVITSGKARIVSGNGDTLLRILERGDMFGAASVFAMDEGNKTSVVASGKCGVTVIPRPVISKIIESDSDAAFRYIGFLSDRINFLNSEISTLAAGDAVSKVAGFLLSLESDEHGHVILENTLTDVAARLNMGRASLYRTIDKFVSKGYISRNKDSLTILDRYGLEDIILRKRSR